MSLPNRPIFPPAPSSSSLKPPIRRAQTGTPSGSLPRNISRRTQTDVDTNRLQPQQQHSYEDAAEHKIFHFDSDNDREHTNREDIIEDPHDATDHHIDTYPPSSFQPFFTLIEDENSSEYYHPTVHYIFSDDDAEIVTEAALRALERNRPDSQKSSTKDTGTHRHQQHHEVGLDGTQMDEENSRSASSNSMKKSLLPPPIPGVRENYIILDVEPVSSETTDNVPGAGTADQGGTRSISTSPATVSAAHPLTQQQQFKVTSAYSLTPKWQVLDTQLVPAPTFENNVSDETQEQEYGQGQRGLMLKILGTSGLPPSNLVGKDKGSQRLEEMMDQFSKRMKELRRVIEAGEKMGGVERRGEPTATPAPAAMLEAETGGSSASPNRVIMVADTGQSA